MASIDRQDYMMAILYKLKVSHIGIGNAISAPDMAEHFGIKNREQIRKMINELRKEGHPICSCHEGFYYPENKGEVLNCITSLESRVEDILACVEGMTRGMKNMRR